MYKLHSSIFEIKAFDAKDNTKYKILHSFSFFLGDLYKCESVAQTIYGLIKQAFNIFKLHQKAFYGYTRLLVADCAFLNEWESISSYVYLVFLYFFGIRWVMIKLGKKKNKKKPNLNLFTLMYVCFHVVYPQHERIDM